MLTKWIRRIRVPSKTDSEARRVLIQTEAHIRKEFRAWLRRATDGNHSGETLEDTKEAIPHWVNIVLELHRARGAPGPYQQTLSPLLGMTTEMCSKASSPRSRQRMAQLLQLLTSCDCRLNLLYLTAKARTAVQDGAGAVIGEAAGAALLSIAADSNKDVLSIPTEILAQCHDILFPAEKMAFVAGRRLADGSIQATAVFDVTGDCGSGHVRGAPPKIHRALIAMEETGSFLAQWVHSHPGAGPGSAHPSPVDHQQHQEWLRTYPKRLVGMIMVRDGYMRFFGDAVEQDLVRVRPEGSAIEEVGDGEFRLSLPWLSTN
ncbi:MAG: hypothetical protein HY671_04180 [Chloroflexi bacterium]|nr:hypothetical protein [Chloroflexota bacterium]